MPVQYSWFCDKQHFNIISIFNGLCSFVEKLFFWNEISAIPGGTENPPRVLDVTVFLKVYLIFQMKTLCIIIIMSAK